MVNILSGPINSGKTTGLGKIYEEIGCGDGFISEKLMDGRNVRGFDLVRLSDGRRIPFVRRLEYSGGWSEECRIGPYSFSGDAVLAVKNVMRELINTGAAALFLDEIGAMELEGKCFDGVFREMIESGIDLYVTVRDGNLSDVVEKYGLGDARLTTTGERYA